MALNPQLRSNVINSFRVLYRTINQSFAGDAVAINTSRAELRSQYRKNMNLTDAATISKLTDEALDAAEFLKQHIVQAKLNDQGRYAMKINAHEDAKKNFDIQTPQDAEAGKDSKSGGCGTSCGCQ